MLLSINPLADNLAWVWDIIALIITFGVIQGLVLVNGYLQKRELLPTFITRKIIHIFAASLYLVCWLLFSGSGSSQYFAMFVPLAFIGQFSAIGFGLRKDEAFVKSMSRSRSHCPVNRSTNRSARGSLRSRSTWPRSTCGFANSPRLASSRSS